MDRLGLGGGGHGGLRGVHWGLNRAGREYARESARGGGIGKELEAAGRGQGIFIREPRGRDIRRMDVFHALRLAL